MTPKNQALARGDSTDTATRPTSGQSTESRATSVAPDQLQAQHPQFARLREQSTVSESDSKHGAQVLEEFSSAAAAASLQPLQTYNSTHGDAVESSLNGSGYPHTSVQPDALHNGPSSKPPSRQGKRGKSGTPQPGAVGADGEKKEKKEKKKMNPSISAANEHELREMLGQNIGRSLNAIAQEVRSSERSQKSERAKQLYAMRWLEVRCLQGKDSVPRNRVYTHYAQRCGNDRVDTLNPASFGKLVRIIFPGIQTRRLGQRGESKYHYVNLRLKDESNFSGNPPFDNGHGFGPLQAGNMDEQEDARLPPCFPADSSAFSLHEQAPAPAQSMFLRPEGNASSIGLVYPPPSWQDDDLSATNSASRMFSRQLKFSPSSQEARSDKSFSLPDIFAFAPAHTDPDLAHALTALYRAHCTSLIDAVRYVREKSFFRLFGTFGGTLTVPVLKLFTNPALAPWIKICDWTAYGEIIRVVSNLDLQVIPEPVWNMLTRVKNELANHIGANYSHYPNFVLQAKMEPATVFTRLLNRLLRLNETAHAAARMLMDDQQRNMMWHDWVRTVSPQRIAESELPACGHEAVTTILTNEVRRLLEPLDDRYYPENGTEFEATRYLKKVGEKSPMSEDVVERWAKFVKSMPGRFPKQQTRTIVHLVNAVSTSALRDITVAQAQSFGSWWVTKCWIDEMLLWMAEMGGFLDAGPSVMTPMTVAPGSSETIQQEDDRGSPRHSNGPQSAGLGIDVNNSPGYAPIQNGPTDPTGPPTATFRFPAKLSTNGGSPLKFSANDETHNDDSGIGMSLLGSDDFKFNDYQDRNVLVQ